MRKLYLSPIEALTNKMKTQPELNGASGAPDIIPSDLFLEAYKKVYKKYECHSYPGAGGSPEARQAYAEYSSKILGLPKISPDKIIATAGAQHAIKLLAELLITKESKVLLENPGFIEGRMPIEYREPIIDTINVSLQGKISIPEKETYNLVYIVPTAHNPLGIDYDPDSRSRIRVLSEKNSIILEDDPYRPIHPDPPPTIWTPGSNVAYVSSLSKALAPGIRSGFIIPPENIIEPLELLSQHDFAPNTIVGCLLLELLDTGDLKGHIMLKRRIYSERLLEMKKQLDSEIPEAEHSNARGGFFITVRTGCDPYKLLEKALKNGISFVPIRDFYLKNPLNDAIRISISRLKLSEIEEYVKRLAKSLMECKKDAHS